MKTYHIFIRPPGSVIWTQHMKRPGIPWVSTNVGRASAEAVYIVNQGTYCTRVVGIDHPDEIDKELTAVLADGDTAYLKS